MKRADLLALREQTRNILEVSMNSIEDQGENDKKFQNQFQRNKVLKWNVFRMLRI
jgi:hypothetical protein